MPNWPLWKKPRQLSHDLKAAARPRRGGNPTEHQADSFSLSLAQAKEDAARETEKAVAQREAPSRSASNWEFAKTLRQREEDFEHRLKKSEQSCPRGGRPAGGGKNQS